MSTTLFNQQVLQQVAKDGRSYPELSKRMAQELLRREESKPSYEAPENAHMNAFDMEVGQAYVWPANGRKFYVRRIE